MKQFIQKLRHILRRKPGQRGLCGTPLLEAAREAERQAAEPQNTEPYICGTFLLNLTPEQREAYFKSLEDRSANG